MRSVLQAVARYTNTTTRSWELIDGPQSRCGVDYWFRHKTTGEEVYANWDQGEISVEVIVQEP